MNWYRIAKNITFPQDYNPKAKVIDDFISDASDVSDIILNNYHSDLKNNRNTLCLRNQPLSFVNPYEDKKTGQKEQREVNIFVMPPDMSKSRIVCEYSPTKNTIFAYPEHLISNGIVRDLGSQLAKEKLASYLIHELAHTVDPKKNKNNKFDDIGRKQKGIKNYYTYPVEFDGFSKQVTEDIKKYIGKDARKIALILDWIRIGTGMPSFVDANIYHAFFREIIKDKVLFIKLKQRIFSDIQNMIESMPKNTKSGVK